MVGGAGASVGSGGCLGPHPIHHPREAGVADQHAGDLLSQEFRAGVVQVNQILEVLQVVRYSVVSIYKNRPRGLGDVFDDRGDLQPRIHNQRSGHSNIITTRGHGESHSRTVQAVHRAQTGLAH